MIMGPKGSELKGLQLVRLAEMHHIYDLLRVHGINSIDDPGVDDFLRSHLVKFGCKTRDELRHQIMLLSAHVGLPLDPDRS